MPHPDSYLSRRRLFIRQKGYHNLNVITQDVLYPRASCTRSPSFRRARGIEEPPSMPECPAHPFGRQPQDDADITPLDEGPTRHNNPVKTGVDATTHGRGSDISGFKDHVIRPSHETICSPRKLPVVARSFNNADEASVPGATWQKATKLSYTYTRGVDNAPPPYLPPYRTTTATTTMHHPKVKASVVSPSRRSHDDPTNSVRYGFNRRGIHHNNNHNTVHAENDESFCWSYSGSSLSSHETRWGCHHRHRAIRLEFQTPSMRSLNSSWYNHRYPSNGPPVEQNVEKNCRNNNKNTPSPRSGVYTKKKIPEYSQFLEEPDYYYEEEEADIEDAPDDMVPPLQDLADSGSSSRGTDKSSSSSSSGVDVVVAMVDIGNGTLRRLRGAEETWRAVANDFYAPGVCTCCESTVFCIQDADYFICPGCRVISPLHDAKPKSIVRGGGGVGLGFTFEELSQWQQEMTATEQLLLGSNQC